MRVNLIHPSTADTFVFECDTIQQSDKNGTIRGVDKNGKIVFIAPITWAFSMYYDS